MTEAASIVQQSRCCDATQLRSDRIFPVVTYEIVQWRNGPRGQGENDGGGNGNVYARDDRYGKKPDNLRKW